MEEKSLWQKFKETKVGSFLVKHSDSVMNVVAGALTVIGGVIYLTATNNDCNNNLYVEAESGKIYKVKAKELPTVNNDEKPKEDI